MNKEIIVKELLNGYDFKFRINKLDGTIDILMKKPLFVKGDYEWNLKGIINLDDRYKLIEFLKDYELTHERNIRAFDYIAKLIGESVFDLYVVDKEAHSFYSILISSINRKTINDITERVTFTSSTPFRYALVHKGLSATIIGKYQEKLLISKQSLISIISFQNMNFTNWLSNN